MYRDCRCNPIMYIRIYVEWQGRRLLSHWLIISQSKMKQYGEPNARPHCWCWCWPMTRLLLRQLLSLVCPPPPSFLLLLLLSRRIIQHCQLSPNIRVGGGCWQRLINARCLPLARVSLSVHTHNSYIHMYICIYAYMCVFMYGLWKRRRTLLQGRRNLNCL